MQLFQVKDAGGNLVMTAPLEVLRWIFRLPVETTVRIMNETHKLGASCELHFGHRLACGRWRELHIERLPLEIPQPVYDSGLLSQLGSLRACAALGDAGRSTSELPKNITPIRPAIDADGKISLNPLGDLLCDQ